MSEWVDLIYGNPPDSHSVLVVIVRYRADSGYYWDKSIVSGFWSSQMEYDYEGWYLDTIEDDLSPGYKRFVGTEFVRLEAWTLMPNVSCSDSYKIKKKIKVGCNE